MSPRVRRIVALVVCVGTCLLVGGSGAFVTATSVKDWYPSINRPSWTPPDGIFGPVWTTLYLLMGVSVWLIWCRSAGIARRRAITIFAFQIALNGVWSFLFFGLRSPGWAALEIVVLFGAIVATIAAFARIDRIAAALLAPYLLWVSFAAALNLTIWNLNR